MPRLQIDVTEGQVRDIEALMRKCGVGTKKELFNNAFVLLDWAVGQIEQGNVIASINEADQRYRELQMPILNTVARRHEAEAVVEAASQDKPREGFRTARG